MFFLNSASAEEVLTWQDCVRESLKNHPDLISAEESIIQTQADKKITASKLFPQISSGLDATTSKVSTSKAADKYSYSVSASQLLFDGFKTSNDVKAASENISAARRNYEFTSSGVRLNLRTAFVFLLKAQESLHIKEEIFNRRRQNFELVTLRYEAGREHKGSLLAEQANLYQAQFEVAQAVRQIEFAQRRLIKELGRSHLTPVTAKGELEIKEAAREKPDFESLAENNPSLQRLIAQKNAAAFSLKSAKAEFFPEVSAEGRAGKSDSHLPPKEDEWSVGAVVSYPLFEGGRRIADVEKAKAGYEKAQADEKSQRNTIIERLQDTWTELQDAIDTVEVRRKFLTAAEERSKIAEAQYSVGFISFNDWIIIEDNLVNAKNAFLDAQANALTAEASWVQAKGETLEDAE